MPTTSAATLYRFEKAFDAAAEAMLKAAGIAASFERMDEDAEGPVSRVVVSAGGFQRASEHMGQSANVQPVWFYNHFRGQLTYEITSPRNSAGREFHENALGKIRAIHAAKLNPFTVPPALPYQVIRCVEGNGSFSYLRAGDRDRSELTYEVEIGINGDSIIFP